MPNKVYPDWVQKQKTTGTTVKKVGNNYYLYKHSSKRVPGKKNPVPVDTYIGKITPDGVEKSNTRKIAANGTEIIVKEFGFSKSVESLCPAGWKEPLGTSWQEVLDYIIVRESPESYITQLRKIPASLEPHIQYAAQKTALLRGMKKEYQLEFKDLRLLSTIYIVKIDGKKFLSTITDEQEKLLERIKLKLEVE